MSARQLRALKEPLLVQEKGTGEDLAVVIPYNLYTTLDRRAEICQRMTEALLLNDKRAELKCVVSMLLDKEGKSLNDSELKKIVRRIFGKSSSPQNLVDQKG